GFGGVYVYMRYPALGARNRFNRSREEMFSELNFLNDGVRQIGRLCDTEVQVVVDSAIDRTNIGGGVFAQLLAKDSSLLLMSIAGAGPSMASTTSSNKDQHVVVDFIAKRIPRSSKKDEAANLQELLVRLCRRQTLLRKIRKDIQLQGWMQVWLFILIPLTIALLFALTIHIVSVFFYW
ncbi:MAG: hypothetical protein JKY66_10690, partial [Spongiibacteraceae bacterium]|nr:hypothetical protein [Spongiibacteraceae bacterium]